MSKRIQRCWPATVARRRTFLPPTSYSHRTGRTAQQVLTRAKHRAEQMLARFHAVVGGVWDIGETVEPSLPRRAEDMLNVLVHEQGLGHAARGARTGVIAEAYVVPVHEVERATAALRSWLCEVPYGDDPFNVTVSQALAAIKDAHYHLGREPIVP